MCSNNKSGTVGYSVEDGETTLVSVRPVDFNNEAWYGEWVSKDLGVYVDIEKMLDIPPLTSDECTITLKGGTPEGSVYINALTIRYEAPDEMQTESPLGWAFEKLEKKSTLNDGDVVMIYRSGCAATDLDGMETSHYLDALPVQSTSNVDVHDILLFTTNKDSEGKWTLTDQLGRKLGARAKQNLAWNEGNTQWTITLGYDGATIANANSNYGTLRYNAPEGSYARFWNYTSTSLQLPYLYRRLHQNEPTLTYSLCFDNEVMTVSMDDVQAIGLRPTISPKNTTDQRMEWTSSNTSVATVDCGYVRMLSVGETVITACTLDNSTEAQMKLIVTGSSTSITTTTDHETNNNTVRKILEHKRIIIKKNHQQINVDGSVLSK